MGRRQCRFRQNLRAGAARDQSCCSRASSRKKSSASPSPRRPPPTWQSVCSTRSPNGPRLMMPISMTPFAQSSEMAPDARRRALARRLFARALETPGGLKVQTIHAFCTQLLHQFPFEANVAARFSVLDDAEQIAASGAIDARRAAGRRRQSRQRAWRKRLNLAMTAARRSDLSRRGARGDRPGRRHQPVGQKARAAWRPRLRTWRGRSASSRRITPTSIEAEYFSGAIIAPSEWPAIANTIARGGKNDAIKRNASRACRRSPARSGSKPISIFSAHSDSADGAQNHHHQGCGGCGLAQRLLDEQQRVWDLLQRRRGVALRDRSAALAHRRVRGRDALRQGEGTPRPARL